MYKIFLIFSSLFIFSACSASTNNYAKNKALDTNITQNQFSSLWNKVKSDPYEKLPYNEVSYSKLFKGEENIILKDAKRTLNKRVDILPYFNKLAHPNGVCFAGIWSINKKTNYSGYFKNNTKALIIARASTAMSNTLSDDTRAFGFAGKIFPTLNKNKINNQKSANFFLIDDLGGTKEKNYTNVHLSNDPTLSFNYEVFKSMFYALEVKDAFEKADKHAQIRQLYEISQLDESTSNIITPKYMKIKAYTNLNVNEKDFRDELKITSDELKFKIYVASEVINEKKQWQDIGNITLKESVSSISCDHRLHFHHPKFKDDLKY